MGLFAEFDVVANFGYPEATAVFGIRPNYEYGNQVFIETFMSVSRSLVPIDTGYLESTLTADSSATYCYAETKCEYAQYPEYGTWCQSAQPYFEPALEEAIWKAAFYWDSAVDAALAEEERLIEAQEAEEEEEEMREAEVRAREGSGEDNNIFGSWATTIGYIIGMMIVIIIREFVSTLFDGGNNYERSRGRDDRDSSETGVGTPYVPEVIIT